jgi:uncharacterized protein (DUF952 family)
VAIFHLTTPDQWADAQSTGWLAPPSLAIEGFVHCSTREQLETTIARHFSSVDQLVILRLHEADLLTDLRWERSGAGEAFPHVYRAIPLTEVAEATGWHRDHDPIS